MIPHNGYTASSHNYKEKITVKIMAKTKLTCHDREISPLSAVTRIRTWVLSATTRSTNHYTITAIASAGRTVLALS